MNNKIETNIAHIKAENAARIARADKFALSVQEAVDPLRAAGFTFHQISTELNKSGLRTPRGNYWTYTSVRNVSARLDAIAADAVAAIAATESSAEGPDTADLNC